MHFGGLLDDPKSDVYNKLNPSMIPNSRLVNSFASFNELLEKGKIQFPLILKPDIGLKGLGVYQVTNIDDVKDYFSNIVEQNILVQEFVNYEKEFSLLFYHMPDSSEYAISSVVEKKYPSFIANGVDTIRKHLESDDNPFLNRKTAKVHLADQLDYIPAKGKVINFHKIGNYSQGSKFFALNEVPKDLENRARKYFENMTGVHFFRVDFKAPSIHDFAMKDCKILEINGVKSEPLHIYDPSIKWSQKIADIRRHWKIIHRIVKLNKRRGMKFPRFRDAVKHFLRLKRLVK